MVSEWAPDAKNPSGGDRQGSYDWSLVAECLRKTLPDKKVGFVLYTRNLATMKRTLTFHSTVPFNELEVIIIN